MHFPISVLPLLLLLEPTFENPVGRGMPFPADNPAIPEAYLGEWASNRSACGKASATTPRLVFEPGQVNGEPIKAVWAYSDSPAIIVSTGPGSDHHRRLHLEISQDEMWLKAQEEGKGNVVLRRRCPVNAEKSERDLISKKAMARACQEYDQEGFLDVFFTSSAAQRSAFSKEIAIIRGDAPKRFRMRNYYRLPPIKDAEHIVYLDNGTSHAVPLKIETVALPGHDFRIDWEEERYGYEGNDFGGYGKGIRGRLTFRFKGGCWKLESDEIRWTDWP